MTADLGAIAFPLFVPADRPDRFGKAFVSGADAVIIDLEDAVAPGSKDAARDALSSAQALLATSPVPVIVRINASDSPEHARDCQAVAQLSVAAIMLPKAASSGSVRSATQATGLPVIALIETARGLAAVRSTADAAARLAFGSADFAADLGMQPTRQALQAARFELVLASRLAGRPHPLDGVTTATNDFELIRGDAAHAMELGFGGKLLIHPAQVQPAMAGFCPSEADVTWANGVLSAGSRKGAVAFEGTMIDTPVLRHAEQILERQRRFGSRIGA